MRWDNIVDAVWRNNGKEEVGSIETWSISYEGPWGTEGKTRSPMAKQTWTANGTATGTVQFDRKTSDVVTHALEWNRTVSVVGHSGQLNQVQQFSGTLERVQ